MKPLLDRIAAGDELAFRELYDDYHLRVYNLALRGGNVAEHRAFFEYAHGLEPQKVVVLTLPFYSYEAEEHRLDPEDAHRLASLAGGPCLYGPDLSSTLLSLDGLPGLEAPSGAGE